MSCQSKKKVSLFNNRKMTSSETVRWKGTEGEQGPHFNMKNSMMSPSSTAGVFWWKGKVARNQGKNAKKIKSVSCSFKIHELLSAKRIPYTQQMKQLCVFGKQRGQISPVIFFFFTKCEPKICLLLLILPKTTSQVWGKGKFRNNGKVPLYSLYWWHKAAAMLSPRQWHSHPPVCRVCPPPKLCRTAVWLHMWPAFTGI